MIRTLAAALALSGLSLAAGNVAPDPQLEANKAVVRRALAALEKGDLTELNVLYEPDGLIHHSRGTDREHGPYANLRTGYPMAAVVDPRQITIELLVAEGDLVTARWTMKGKHAGEYRGVAPTGRELTIPYTNIFRIRNGRIAENWVGFNQLALLEQLGMTVCAEGSGK